MRSLWTIALVGIVGCAQLFDVSAARADTDPRPPTVQPPSGLQRWIDATIPSPASTPTVSALRDAIRSTPSGDPIFDTAPADLARYRPGEIIEARDVTRTSAPLAILPIQRAALLKFRTTDASGAPSFATATLVVPAAPWQGPGSRPVLVNALPINSLGLRCTPGYAMAHGVHDKFNAGDLFPPTTGWGISRGYAVLIPDHEGPLMAYAEPTVAGHAVLDSIRAARSLPNREFAESRFAIGGYSGGAIASYAAAMLQPDYAPELGGSLVGATMGGTPTNYRTLAHKFNGNSASGILLVVALAMAREYPELLGQMNHLAQWVATSPLKDTCGDSNGQLGVIGIPVEVATNVSAPLDSDVAEKIYRRTDLTDRKSGTPIYIYHGANDFWIPVEGAKDLFRRECALGVPAVYRPQPGEHITTLIAGFPGAMDWLDARLRGVPAPSECPS